MDPSHILGTELSGLAEFANPYRADRKGPPGKTSCQIQNASFGIVIDLGTRGGLPDLPRQRPIYAPDILCSYRGRPNS
jgi:hypothetical protein